MLKNSHYAGASFNYFGKKTVAVMRMKEDALKKVVRDKIYQLS